MKNLIFPSVLFVVSLGLSISILSYYKKDIDNYIVDYVNKNESLKTFLMK